MIWYSLYPTDSENVTQKILQQAKKYEIKNFFVSLHLPEIGQLRKFLDLLGTLHQTEGYNFVADISPHTLLVLGIEIDELTGLIAYGITVLRIDFGFSDLEIQQISKLGFTIAVNASTTTTKQLNILQDIALIGWHNYYPRPETGLNQEFFQQQNVLFKQKNMALYSFIPGTEDLRAPLELGLPTLEKQREKNAYINYLEQKQKYQIDTIVLAEGTLDEEELEAIIIYEKEGIITVPCSEIAKPYQKILLDKIWRVRFEETDASWRLEETRGIKVAENGISKIRTKGSIQIDTALYGRYQGEIHIIKKDLRADERTLQIGMIKPEYQEIIDYLQRSPYIKFTI